MSFSRGPKIVTDGLVLCLDAANKKSYPGSGTTWTDLSGQGNNGALTNMSAAPFDSGNVGSLVFDGVNDYVNVTGINVSTLNSFTLECWVYPTSNIADETAIGRWSSTQSLSSFLLYWDVGTALGFDFVVRNNVQTIYRIGTSTANGARNEWNHTVGTFSSSEIQRYVNGSLEGTSSFSGTLNNNSGFRIGGEDAGRNLGGNITLVKVYNKVLSSTEIQQNYNATKGRFGL